MNARLQLLSAFQVLSMPERAYGVTHARAREVIREHTGAEPVGTPPTSCKTLEDYGDWFALNHREEETP